MFPGVSAVVGKTELGAINRDYDVLLVQRLLKKTAKVANDPSLDPREENGQIPRPSHGSATIKALEAFQDYFELPTGLVYPGGRTMCRLLNVAEGNPNIQGGYYFPFTTVPLSWNTNSMRRFSANRANGTRAHAGCDLYFPAGTDIYAVADGLVIEGPLAFYNETDYLVIEHGHMMVRYGEIQKNTAYVEMNQRVAGGQKIARVGHLVPVVAPSDMLHFEMYGTTARSPLTVAAQSSRLRADGVPYLRRQDLLDPSDFLDRCSTHLPKPYTRQPAKQGWLSY